MGRRATADAGTHAPAAAQLRAGLAALLTALLVFPQIVETIYSPALADIGRAFRVAPQLASQTLSCYFASFALGVLAWGWLSDRWGRRPAMLAGLAIYAIASLAALLVDDFTALLLARVASAFGAAAGSVVTQTMMRDRLQGGALAHAFAKVGVALALSPALGLLSGSALAHAFGYRGVFVALFALAGLLLCACVPALPETRPPDAKALPLRHTLRRMVGDQQVWLALLLIAALNIALFSFYALAPFLFERARLPEAALASGGAALALGSLVGGRLSALWLRRGRSPVGLFAGGLGCNALGALLVLASQHTGWCVPAMSIVSLGFAMVIPVVLGRALSAYADQRGSAGALLGLAYYALIGAGLALAGWCQDLGWTLVVCASVAAACGGRYRRFLRADRVGQAVARRR